MSAEWGGVKLKKTGIVLDEAKPSIPSSSQQKSSYVSTIRATKESPSKVSSSSEPKAGAPITTPPPRPAPPASGKSASSQVSQLKQPSNGSGSVSSFSSPNLKASSNNSVVTPSSHSPPMRNSSNSAAALPPPKSHPPVPPPTSFKSNQPVTAPNFTENVNPPPPPPRKAQPPAPPRPPVTSNLSNEDHLKKNESSTQDKTLSSSTSKGFVEDSVDTLGSFLNTIGVSSSASSSAPALPPSKPPKPIKPTIELIVEETDSQSLLKSTGVLSKYKTLVPVGNNKAPEGTSYDPTALSASTSSSTSSYAAKSPKSPAPPPPVSAKPSSSASGAKSPISATNNSCDVDSTATGLAKTGGDSDASTSASGAGSGSGTSSSFFAAFSGTLVKDLTIYEGIGANISLDGAKRLEELEALMENGEKMVGRRLVCEGLLQKGTRRGAETYYFILTADALLYCKGSVIPGVTRLAHHRTIPLNTMMVLDVNSNKITPSQDDTENSFYIFSKEKSFSLHAERLPEKNTWVAKISQCVRDVHNAEGLNYKISDFAPVWKTDNHITACELCQTEFTMLFRKHHCRNCGKCVCDSCSREKVRIPRIDERALFKVAIIDAYQ